MRDKVGVAVVGYGNIGASALKAVEEAPDCELAGVVRRESSLERETPPELRGKRVVSDIGELEGVDTALLAVPTRLVEDCAREILSRGINTVDSFDIHGEELLSLRRTLDRVGRENGSVAVVSAGWDPGTDSMIRSMFEFMTPRGITYTDFGPGMSMGHTVALKRKEGVRRALSITVPRGTGLHRRMVYIELEDGADPEEVERAIRSDPYFAHDETVIEVVDDVDRLTDRGHGVVMSRKGVSGRAQNQLLNFEMKINNPALTSQVMVAAARASVRQDPGAYTMIEIPIIDYMTGDRERLVRELI